MATRRELLTCLFDVGVLTLITACGGGIVFALENDVIDFDPMPSRAFVDRNAHYQIYGSIRSKICGGSFCLA